MKIHAVLFGGSDDADDEKAMKRANDSAPDRRGVASAAAMSDFPRPCQHCNEIVLNRTAYYRNHKKGRCLVIPGDPREAPARSEMKRAKKTRDDDEVRSIHWSPYDPVRVVDADP